MNKYLGILIVMSVVLAASAAVSADGEEIQSMSIGEDTYYIHSSGLFKETNGCDGLQLSDHPCGANTAVLDADQRVL